MTSGPAPDTLSGPRSGPLPEPLTGPEGGALSRGRTRPSRAVVMTSASALLGLLGSGALVWHGTDAVFTATTPNASNSWSVATVTLSDNDGGSAMFNLSNLLPGSTGANCIVVTYGGSVGTAVKLYASAAADASTVAQYVDLVIEEGTGGTFNNCAGFATSGTIYTGTLATFTSTKNSYANGVGTWAPAGAASKVYKVSYTLNASTPNTKQGATTTATLQWEAQAGS